MIKTTTNNNAGLLITARKKRPIPLPSTQNNQRFLIVGPKQDEDEDNSHAHAQKKK
jgi:hypothetical protein